MQGAGQGSPPGCGRGPQLLTGSVGTAPPGEDGTLSQASGSAAGCIPCAASTSPYGPLRWRRAPGGEHPSCNLPGGRGFPKTPGAP